ncbi:MAG: replicative helicase loader/inhibitor [Bacillota bacterium]
MQKPEVVQLLSYLNGCYNSFNFPKNNEAENKLIIEIWTDFLQYYNKDLVYSVLKKIIIHHNNYPPQVGEIVREIERSKLSTEEKLNAGDAWALVLKAVRKYGYYRAAEALDSLPPAVRKAVENFGGFNAICHSQSNDSYIRTQFMNIYNQIKKEREEYQLLPAALKQELLETKIKKLESTDRY